MKALPFLLVLLASKPLLAQQTTGTITYEQTISIDLKGAEGLPEGLAAMLPKEQKFKKVLYFIPTAALYQYLPGKASNVNEYAQDNVGIRIEQHTPDDKVYTDLNTKTITEQKEFMGRMFLINKPADAPKWKFTGRQKKLLNLPCLEAVAVKDKDTLVAWYTPSVPVSIGPEGVSGLPGAILELSMGSMLNFKATAITPANATAQIKAPGKGKKLTEAEFDKMVKVKEEEMLKQYGGGDGKTTIMINAGPK